MIQYNSLVFSCIPVKEQTYSSCGRVSHILCYPTPRRSLVYCVTLFLVHVYVSRVLC